MNKNVIIAIFIVSVIFFAIVLLLQGRQEKNSTVLTANPTLPPAGQTQNANATQAPQTTPIPTSEYVSAIGATIKTSKGDIVVKLYPEDAPKTVTNFATLAKIGYYNNLTFHRVIPGFVIQGGDPTGTGNGGSSIYGNNFEDELNPATQSYKEGYVEGTLAMANSGPNTNASQFFITSADQTAGLERKYTIFGRVLRGMDVVKNIQVGDKILTITLGLPEGLNLDPTSTSSPSAAPTP